MSTRCSALVVGAGPAGSMAAWKLARSGVETLIVDRSAFPREKVCGDALLPDALQALEDADLAEMVRAEALEVHSATFRSPGGKTLVVKGRFLTIARAHLDALLLRAAMLAGARFLPGYEVLRPVFDGSGVCGVEGREAGAGEGREPGAVNGRILCKAIVLCCGSNPRLLQAFGVLTRPLHSAIAIRGYLPADPFAEDTSHPKAPPSLLISYDRTLLPGYGWSFPLPGKTWNVGCGVFVATEPRRTRSRASITRLVGTRRSAPARTDDANLRRLLRIFLDSAGAGASARERPEIPRQWWQTVRGATLRTGFTGSLPSQGQVLVAGEALGLTLPLTGDGIGKAMQSGLIAGDVIARGLARSAASLDLSSYARTLESRIRPTQAAYAAAQTWMRYPAVSDLIVRRASRSPKLRALVEEILAETTDPRALLSPAGLVRALLST